MASDVRIGPSQRDLFRQLCGFASMNGAAMTCRVYVETLARERGQSERTVYRNLATLRKAGVLDWSRTGRSSVFTITLPMREIEAEAAERKAAKRQSKPAKPVSPDKTLLASPQNRTTLRKPQEHRTHRDSSRVDDIPSLVAVQQLCSLGMYGPTAKTLVSRHGAERVEEVLRALADQKKPPTKPTGWVLRALTEEWNLEASRKPSAKRKPSTNTISDAEQAAEARWMETLTEDQRKRTLRFAKQRGLRMGEIRAALNAHQLERSATVSPATSEEAFGEEALSTLG